MEFEELVVKTRSYRRFDESLRIDKETLLQLVSLARRSPSAANKQPLKYILSWEPKKNEDIFSCLAWAGYLTEWEGPTEGERPAGYIVILKDSEIAEEAEADMGIAAQTILLGATAMGYGGCMFGAIKRERLRKLLSLDDRYRILLVVALGKPVEQVVIDDTQPDRDIKYWRDEHNVHHVPKRPLDELILP